MGVWAAPAWVRAGAVLRATAPYFGLSAVIERSVAGWQRKIIPKSSDDNKVVQCNWLSY